MGDTARYIMVGGFLGAGKTTTLIRLAEKLQAEGKKVGLITNDQAADLVDTALVKSGNFPVEEIAGGCFCCRFNSLKEAVKLVKNMRLIQRCPMERRVRVLCFQQAAFGWTTLQCSVSVYL